LSNAEPGLAEGIRFRRESALWADAWRASRAFCLAPGGARELDLEDCRLGAVWVSFWSKAWTTASIPLFGFVGLVEAGETGAENILRPLLRADRDLCMTRSFKRCAVDFGSKTRENPEFDA
jgi:hypothetical protein